MKKIILITVVVIVAALPVIPYTIGTTVEENIRLEHEEGAREAALSGFDIKLVDYQRGLFDASATTRISFTLPQEREPVDIELRHHISHIPQLTSRVIATVETRLVLKDEVAIALSPLFGAVTPLTSHTHIFLDGHQEATLSSPPANGRLHGKESAAVAWQGLEGTAWQSPERDAIRFTLHAPGIVINPLRNGPRAANDAASDTVTDTPATPAEAISLSDLHYQGELHKGASGIWQGKAQGDIAAFTVDLLDQQSGAPIALHIDTINLHGEQDESHGLINASGAMRAKRITFNDTELSDAHYDIAIENLDAAALRAWQTTAQQMMKQQPAANPFAPMREHLPALLNAHPIIKINELSVMSKEGRFALTMEAHLNGEWNEMLLENPLLFTSQLEANLSASVPRSTVVTTLQEKVRQAILTQAAASEGEISDEDLESAVEQGVNQQLSALLDQGYIKENGGQLESRVEYNAGQLTINGMDASPLMGAMMQ